MEYTFKEKITSKEYHNFIKKQQTLSFMQEEPWGKVKQDQNWSYMLCGVYQKKKLVAACMILIRKVMKKINMFYVPRGYLIDFTNKELLSFFTENIRQLAKKYNAYVVKIDPNFCKSERLFKELQKDYTQNYTQDYNIKHQNLLDLGYKHTGFSTNLHKNFQPRFNMAVPLVDKNNKLLTEDEVLKSFKSKFRYYLGNYHTKRGVSFEITQDQKRVKEFVEILKYTEKTQGIKLRDEEYFKKILQQFPNRTYLIFGKVDLPFYLNFLRENNGKTEEIIEVEELIKVIGDELIVSSALLLLPENDSIRTSEYLYAGNNLAFPKLSVSAGVCFEAVKLSIKNKCNYCNLGGVDGSLKDPLSIFKSKYNAIVLEFAGEYDLIINKGLYYGYKVGYPILRKINKLRK